MAGATSTTIDWLAMHVLPHEAAVRRWLIASGTAPDEADDLIQDAYCRLGDLSSVDHITAPRAYSIRIVQNLRREGFRRRKVVRFDALTEIHASSIVDEREDPERIADARRQLATVSAVLAGLPARCREIFRLRRMEGLSQKEIARKMGVSEGVVENDAAKAVRHLLSTLRADGQALADEADRRRA
ncbi:RNA polymerase sigma factor [uncultured Sphingomonas sp.]|uniref:RNA polymerase sigma factor n=1 Tax=uncultured Sphingomonas sp. TaxID=158754 RepID=UPI0025E20ACB|nr:RNA polymerase sigma factor [uncultured Sphingomonas sp.]